MPESETASGSTRRVLLLVLLRICNWISVVGEELYLRASGFMYTCIVISISTVLTGFVIHSESTGHRRCSFLRSMVIAFLQVAIVFEVMDCCGCGAKENPGTLVATASTSAVELADTSRYSRSSFNPKDSFLDMMEIPTFRTMPTETSRRIPRPRSFAKQRRFVRKLMIFSLPEAAYSVCYTLWQLMVNIEDLKWFKGPKCAENPNDNREGDYEERFNEWFKMSDHGIIKRSCNSCDREHRFVYYRRLYHKSEKARGKVFKPYNYMMREWKQDRLKDGPDNNFHIEFDLFSEYKDAIDASAEDRWQNCTTWSENESRVGFPGDCGKHTPGIGQNSTLFSDDGNFSCNHIEGQPRFSYRVERTFWKATIYSLLQEDYFSDITEALTSFYMFFMMAVAVTALANCFRDTIVWVWTPTAFVKEHSLFVILFYLFEICSFAPIVVFLFFYAVHFHNIQLFILPFMVNFLFNFIVTIMGFYVKFAHIFRAKGKEMLSQVLFSVCVAFFIFFVNFLYFDRSLTFRHLRKTYYIFRLCFVTACLFWRPHGFTHPLVVIALLASILLALMVWRLIPAKRMQHENAVMEKARGRMEEMMLTSGMDGEEGSLHRAKSALEPLGRAATGLERARTSQCTSATLDVLNTVGDTFEALLLASKTTSPRVRQMVLEGAVAPLRQAQPVLLRQLLPLILPQLLLALRWRTVAEDEDEFCPLTHFVIDSVLTCSSTELVTIVYWELLVLSTDRSEATFETYRSVRTRFLSVLQKHTFDGKLYKEEFCNSALMLLANQGRLYSQMRSVARWCSQPVHGSPAQKSQFLKTKCLSPKVRRIWQGKKMLASRLGGETTVRQILAESSMYSFEEEPRTRNCFQTCFVKAFRFCLLLACSCCPFYQQRNRQEDDDDAVKEEWEKDSGLWDFEDVDVDLIEPKITPLPVDPKDPIVGVDAQKSFVAHSAVAPVVFCCKMAGQSEDRKRLFALKNGDDLRQDALVLQIFKLMETVWRENGLKECVLKPYSVRPVSPTEGMVAFVPKSEKVSTIIFEYDGDFVKFITNRCPTDKEKGFDLLCGSTAAYCVATFVLGIGDRHLDNLMITEDGRFFHIDFGFVLGSDPKPCAPQVRVPREIVDAIKAADRYERFLNLVGEAYLLLRCTPRLWSALLGLTREAGGNGVEELKTDGSVSTVLERLHLDLDNESAKTQIINEVESSAASPLPMVFDKLHQLGLFWR